MRRLRLFDYSLMDRVLRYLLSTSAILLAIGFFAGCSTPPPVGGIDANLAKIHADASRDITATILYVNDSTRPVAVQSAEHQVYIAGQLAGHARMKTPLGLPPLSTTERTVVIIPESTLGQNFLNDAARTTGAYWRLNSRIAINLAGEEYILRSDTKGELGKP